MRVQSFVRDLFQQQVAPFYWGFCHCLFQQRVAPFYRTLKMTTDQQTCLLVRSDRLVLGMLCTASDRWWRRRNPRPRRTVAHDLLIELGVSHREEVVLGLITCGGEVVVSRPHLLGESAQEIFQLNLGEVEGQ